MIDTVEDSVDMMKRHLDVLRTIIINEPIGIVSISKETGYPDHKVRYSLRVLEEEDAIKPSDYGAFTTEETNEFVDRINDELDEIEVKFIEIKNETDGD
jgi:predicted transcriptional regulator